MKQAFLCIVVFCTMTSVGVGGQLFNSDGFEDYTLGDLPGQDGWVVDNNEDYGLVQVIDDPTGAGMGNVIVLDPPGTAGGWQGVARAAGPSTLPIVRIEWDQYRTGTTDNFWIADAVAFDGWWALQWDQNSQASSYFFEFGVPVSTGVWQHVAYTLDTTAGTARVEFTGVGSWTSLQPDTAINGIVFEIEPTEAGGADGPTYIDNLSIVETVPEPGTVMLGALAGVGLLLVRRLRRAANCIRAFDK